MRACSELAWPEEFGCETDIIISHKWLYIGSMSKTLKKPKHSAYIYNVCVEVYVFIL